MVWQNERGLSLIEMVIAMTLLGLVALTFYGLVSVAVQGWAALEGQLDVQQHPRVAVGRLGDEIRQSRDFVIAGGGTALGLVKATLLTQDASGGATSFTVEDASALAVNRPIVLIDLNRLEQVTVTAIAGTTVTVTPALTFPHKQGELIRRAQSALASAPTCGVSTCSLTLASGGGSAFQIGDSVAVGGEAPFTVMSVVGDTLTITPVLVQSHTGGEAVQPLTVVFQLSGSQLTRCVQNCDVSSNQIVLADLLTVPSGKQFFSSVQTTLSTSGAPGATQICVQSTVGFAVNDQIQVGRDTYGTRVVAPADRRIVTAIGSGGSCSAGFLTLNLGLNATHAAGDVVRVRAVDLNVLATQFNDAIQQTQEVPVATKVQTRN